MSNETVKMVQDIDVQELKNRIYNIKELMLELEESDNEEYEQNVEAIHTLLQDMCDVAGDQFIERLDPMKLHTIMYITNKIYVILDMYI